MRRRPANSANLAKWKRIHDSKFHRTVLQRPPRDLDVVERNRVIGKFLVGLVAFAGDEDDVARLRERDGAGDRFRAIGDLLVTLGAKTFLDLGDDRHRDLPSADYRK